MALRDRAARWLANHLPARVVYFAAVRVWAHGCLGKYGDQEVPTLTIADALVRFEKDKTLWAVAVKNRLLVWKSGGGNP